MISVRLQPELDAALDEFCEKNDRTKTEVMRAALDQYINDSSHDVDGWKAGKAAGYAQAQHLIRRLFASMKEGDSVSDVLARAAEEEG